MEQYGNPKKRDGLATKIILTGFVCVAGCIFVAVILDFQYGILKTTLISVQLQSIFLMPILLGIFGILMILAGINVFSRNEKKIIRLNRQLDVLENRGSQDDVLDFAYVKHHIDLSDAESILSLGCDPKKLGRFIISLLHITLNENVWLFSNERKSSYQAWINIITYAICQQQKLDKTFISAFMEGCHESRHADLYESDITNLYPAYINLSPLSLIQWVDRKAEVDKHEQLRKTLGITGITVS